MAKAAEVASQMVRPVAVVGDPVAVRHAHARGGAVPGEDDVARRIDRGEIGQLRRNRRAAPSASSFSCLTDVGHPAFAEALPGEQGRPAAARAALHSAISTAPVSEAGTMPMRWPAGTRSTWRVSSIAWPSRALPSFERCERPSDADGELGGGPARRLGAGAGREIRARAGRTRRLRQQVSHVTTLLAESTRRVGTAWPVDGLRGQCGCRKRVNASLVALDGSVEAIITVHRCGGGSCSRRCWRSPPASRAASSGARRRAPDRRPGRAQQPDDAAMPCRSRPRAGRLPGAARPALRRRLLGARRGAADRDRHAGHQSRRDDLPARRASSRAGRARRCSRRREQWLGAPVRRIETFGTYSCRGVNGQPGARCPSMPSPMRSTSRPSCSPTAGGSPCQTAGTATTSASAASCARSTRPAAAASRSASRARRERLSLQPFAFRHGPRPLLPVSGSLSMTDDRSNPQDASSSPAREEAETAEQATREPADRWTPPTGSPSRTWTSCCARICGRSASSSNC